VSYSGLGLGLLEAHRHGYEIDYGVLEVAHFILCTLLRCRTGTLADFFFIFLLIQIENLGVFFLKAKKERSMKWQRFVSVPVFLVIILLGFVYYVTIFIFLEDWLGLQSSAGSLNALIFSLLASLCVFSFSICVLTEPGHIPSTYIPDVEDNGASDQGPTKTVSFLNDFVSDPFVFNVLIGALVSYLLVSRCNCQAM